MSRVSFTAALLMLLTAPLSAQPAGQPGAVRYLNVVSLVTELGGAPAWEAYEREVQEARRRLGVDRNVLIYQVRMGDTSAQYRAVIPFADFADMDGWRSPAGVMAEVHGAEEGARMNPNVTRTVENTVHELQPDLSSGDTRAGSRDRYIQVVETQIDPALDADYRAFLRSLAAAEDAQGVRAIRRTATLGPAFTFYSVTGFATLGDLRSGPGPVALLAGMHGQELADEIWARGNAAVRERRVFVMELREDLSYIVN
jgi:hypothetical protein